MQVSWKVDLRKEARQVARKIKAGVAVSRHARARIRETGVVSQPLRA